MTRCGSVWPAVSGYPAVQCARHTGHGGYGRHDAPMHWNTRLARQWTDADIARRMADTHGRRLQSG